MMDELLSFPRLSLEPTNFLGKAINIDGVRQNEY